MAAEKTRAIVLRLVEFSETSLVTTLFTEDFGKVGALAKGARRPKSAFEGALDLLALVRIVFLRKSSDSLDLLTEARLERRFRSAQRDLPRLYAGYYVAELLAELTDTGDPHPALFAAADQTLEALDQGAAPAETVLRFELAALKLLGHLPSLAACVVCGREVTGDERVPLSMIGGGVLCGECRPGRRGVVSVSGGVLAALRSAAGEEAASRPLVPAIRGELRAVMNNYIAHLVGHRLRLPEYLGTLA
jgi:DNA repair protein RecO (recombination protein O)